MAGANVFASDKRHHKAGFTLIEVAVVVCVVAVASGLLLERFLFYKEQAEKAAMEHTVGALRSALNLQVASLVAKNRAHELSGLGDKNPMDWLAEKPKNYIGEYFAPNQVELTVGNWYFDLQKRNLVYLIKGKTQGSSVPGNKGVRFQVKLIKKIELRQAATSIEGVVLEQIDFIDGFERP